MGQLSDFAVLVSDAFTANFHYCGGRVFVVSPFSNRKVWSCDKERKVTPLKQMYSTVAVNLFESVVVDVVKKGYLSFH